MTERPAARRGITAALVAALLPLGGCGGASQSAPAVTSSPDGTFVLVTPSDTPTATASDTPTADATSATASPTAVATTPSPKPSVGGSNHPFPPNPARLPATTPPGTRLSFVQSAVITQPGGDDPKGKKGLIYERITPIDVVKGDQSVLKTLSNAKEFPGGTIWYVHYRVQVLAMTGATHQHGTLQEFMLTAVDAKGKGLGWLFGTSTPCPAVPDYDELFVGSDVRDCTVVIAKKGQLPKGLLTAGAISDDPARLDAYSKDPVVWLR